MPSVKNIRVATDGTGALTQAANAPVAQSNAVYTPAKVTTVVGPPGAQGVGIGSATITSTYDLVLVLTDGSTLDAGALPPGPVGPQGPIGNTGPIGLQGIQGPQGPIGSQGPIGLQGANGVAGPAGVDGANGAVGPQGPAGANGAVGPQGPAGANGAVGPQGPQGLQGPAGPAGADGIPEAPQDGNFYARCNGTWVMIPITVDAPSDGNFYGRENGTWVIGSASSVSNANSNSGSVANSTSNSTSNSSVANSTANSTSNSSVANSTTTPAPHLYWTIAPTIPSGGIGLGELSMMDGGADLCTGGTPIATGTYDPGQFGPANAFDGDPNTFWCGTDSPAVIGYQFASPVNITSMTLTSRGPNSGSYGAQFPSGAYTVQYSDDGQTYTQAWSGTLPSLGNDGSSTTITSS